MKISFYISLRYKALSSVLIFMSAAHVTLSLIDIQQALYASRPSCLTMLWLSIISNAEIHQQGSCTSSTSLSCSIDDLTDYRP